MLKAGPKPNWGKRPPKLCKDGKYRSYNIAQAHHDFPWARKDWFAAHGLDVNNPVFGRWVSDAEHYSWHHDAEPAFNNVWIKYIADEAHENSPYTIDQILQKLAEVRAQFPVTGAN